MSSPTASLSRPLAGTSTLNTTSGSPLVKGGDKVRRGRRRLLCRADKGFLFVLVVRPRGRRRHYKFAKGKIKMDLMFTVDVSKNFFLLFS